MPKQLDPSDKDDIYHVEQQLGDLIQEVHGGKQDAGRLFYIGQQLSTLTKSKTIPNDVKEKLQAALRELQSESFLELPVSRMMAAQTKIHEAIQEKPIEN